METAPYLRSYGVALDYLHDPRKPNRLMFLWSPCLESSPDSNHLRYGTTMAEAQRMPKIVERTWLEAIHHPVRALALAIAVGALVTWLALAAERCLF